AGGMVHGEAWPAPSTQGVPGAGLAVLVNANAKRGGRRVAVQIARTLPAASIRLTKTTQEIDAWLKVLQGPRAVFAAGGDGSAVSLVNALARMAKPGEPLMTMGILPLGTGNGWALSLGPHADAGAAADAPVQSHRGRGDARPLRRVGVGRDDPRRLQAPARAEQGADAPVLEERVR